MKGYQVCNSQLNENYHFIIWESLTDKNKYRLVVENRKTGEKKTYNKRGYFAALDKMNELVESDMKKNTPMKKKAKLTDGTICIIMERGEYFTKVLTPFHDIINVSNRDIVEEIAE